MAGLDTSYDQFAGGWGDDGDNDNGMQQAQGRQSMGAPVSAERANMFDKIPLPVTLSNLSLVEPDQDKYKIGNDYSFGTIRTIARVLRVTEIPGCVTYECCDTTEVETDKIPHEEMFPIIRYFGVDTPNKGKPFDVGTLVLAMGKLRTFSGRASLISFHIIKVDSPEDVNMFQKEAELAALYYEKRFPDLSAQGLLNCGIPMFSPLPPERKPFNANDFQQAGGSRMPVGRTPTRTTPSAMGARTTPSAMGARGAQQPQTPNTAGGGRRVFNTQSASKMKGLNMQQQKIYECIKECANNSEGVSLDQIKMQCRISGDCMGDLNHLFGEGLIFNTVDDYHYAAI